MCRAASYLRYIKYLFRFSFRWFLFLYCSIAQLFNHCSAESEEVIQVDTFLASVNLSEQKVFFVRNNLEVSRLHNSENYIHLRIVSKHFYPKRMVIKKRGKQKQKRSKARQSKKKKRLTKHTRTNSQTRKTISLL